MVADLVSPPATVGTSSTGVTGIQASTHRDLVDVEHMPAARTSDLLDGLTASGRMSFTSLVTLGTMSSCSTPAVMRPDRANR
jgi:hypothetical protein